MDTDAALAAGCLRLGLAHVGSSTSRARSRTWMLGDSESMSTNGHRRPGYSPARAPDTEPGGGSLSGLQSLLVSRELFVEFVH